MMYVADCPGFSSGRKSPALQRILPTGDDEIFRCGTSCHWDSRRMGSGRVPEVIRQLWCYTARVGTPIPSVVDTDTATVRESRYTVWCSGNLNQDSELKPTFKLRNTWQ